MKSSRKLIISGLVLPVLAFAAALIAGGCAGTMALPQGSTLMGDYQGRFNGQFSWGNIKVRVYDAPDGSRPVYGNLDPVEGSAIGIFRGEMNGSRLEARFLEAEGNLTGELSADGKSMSGTFTFANTLGPPATWNAQKK